MRQLVNETKTMRQLVNETIDKLANWLIGKSTNRQIS